MGTNGAICVVRVDSSARRVRQDAGDVAAAALDVVVRAAHQHADCFVVRGIEDRRTRVATVGIEIGAEEVCVARDHVGAGGDLGRQAARVADDIERHVDGNRAGALDRQRDLRAHLAVEPHHGEVGGGLPIGQDLDAAIDRAVGDPVLHLSRGQQPIAENKARVGESERVIVDAMAGGHHDVIFDQKTRAECSDGLVPEPLAGADTVSGGQCWGDQARGAVAIAADRRCIDESDRARGIARVEAGQSLHLPTVVGAIDDVRHDVGSLHDAIVAQSRTCQCSEQPSAKEISSASSSIFLQAATSSGTGSYAACGDRRHRHRRRSLVNVRSQKHIGRRRGRRSAQHAPAHGSSRTLKSSLAGASARQMPNQARRRTSLWRHRKNRILHSHPFRRCAVTILTFLVRHI